MDHNYIGQVQVNCLLLQSEVKGQRWGKSIDSCNNRFANCCVITHSPHSITPWGLLQHNSLLCSWENHTFSTTHPCINSFTLLFNYVPLFMLIITISITISMEVSLWYPYRSLSCILIWFRETRTPIQLPGQIFPLGGIIYHFNSTQVSSKPQHHCPYQLRL